MKKRIYILLMLTLLLISSVSATDYFFSNSGNDSQVCTSTGTVCRTITKLNTISLNGSDNVFFNRGNTWRLETDAYPSFDNGNSTALIYYGAYGTGEKPVFLGSVNMSSSGNWTNSTATWWHAVNTITTDAGNLIYNNENSTGFRERFVSDVNAQGEWHYNQSTNNLTVYSTTNPGTFYNYIEVAVKASGQEMMFNFDDKSFITISNWSAKYGGVGAFNGERMTNISWLENDVRYTGGDIQVPGTRYGNCMDIQLNATNILVQRNNVTQCFDGCLTLEAFSTGGAANMQNVEISYNLFTECFYPFEYFSSNTSSIVNKINIHHNTFALAGNNFDYNNRFAQTIVVSQVRLSRTPAATTDYNFTDNIIYTNRYFSVFMGSASNSNWKGDIFQDRNLYFNVSDNVLIHWNGTQYASLAAFQAAVPIQDVNSNETDPLFIDLVDYRPYANSPACFMDDTGSFVGAVTCSLISNIQTPTPTANLLNLSNNNESILLNASSNCEEKCLLYINGTNEWNITGFPFNLTNISGTPLINNTAYPLNFTVFNSSNIIPESNFSNTITVTTLQNTPITPPPTPTPTVDTNQYQVSFFVSGSQAINTIFGTIALIIIVLIIGLVILFSQGNLNTFQDGSEILGGFVVLVVMILVALFFMFIIGSIGNAFAL